MASIVVAPIPGAHRVQALSPPSRRLPRSPIQAAGGWRAWARALPPLGPPLWQKAREAGISPHLLVTPFLTGDPPTHTELGVPSAQLGQPLSNRRGFLLFAFWVPSRTFHEDRASTALCLRAWGGVDTHGALSDHLLSRCLGQPALCRPGPWGRPASTWSRPRPRQPRVRAQCAHPAPPAAPMPLRGRPHHQLAQGKGPGQAGSTTALAVPPPPAGRDAGKPSSGASKNQAW